MKEVDRALSSGTPVSERKRPRLLDKE